jgi:hypothetical protein
LALEQLGYVKCHHMMEVMQSSSNLAYWNEMHEKRSTDFDAMLKGYQAIVDFPGSLYYKELILQYPDAKVILSVRDPEKWYLSCRNTIYQVPKGFEKFTLQIKGLFNPKIRTVLGVYDFATRAIWGNLFKNNFDDKEFAIKTFNEWIDEVKRTVPENNLLIFEAKDGWKPLCEFLNKPIPSTPYPKVNDTLEFQKRMINKVKNIN